MLEELIDANVLNQIHNVAVHAGVGAAAGAAAGVAFVHRNGEYLSDRHYVAIGFAAVAAAAVGPHLFGDAISTYLHAQTVGGVLLGLTGAVVAPTTIGYVAGGYLGSDGTGNDSGLVSAWLGGLVGLAAGTGTYLVSELLRLGM